MAMPAIENRTFDEIKIGEFSRAAAAAKSEMLVF
jgi:hypothetical protein